MPVALSVPPLSPNDPNNVPDEGPNNPAVAPDLLCIQAGLAEKAQLSEPCALTTKFTSNAIGETALELGMGDGDVDFAARLGRGSNRLFRLPFIFARARDGTTSVRRWYSSFLIFSSIICSKSGTVNWLVGSQSISSGSFNLVNSLMCCHGVAPDIGCQKQLVRAW